MRDRLRKIPFGVYKMLFNIYAAELPEKLNKSKTKWNDNGLNVIVIRCNDIYVTNEMKRNNDWMILFHKGLKYIFQCTADPKQRKNRIANLCEQVYFGNIRPHKWIRWRTCIAQDKCKLWVHRFTNRTDFYNDFGHFGINIHNPAKYFNSSLGCVILAYEKRYTDVFKPLLLSVENKNNIPVAVMNISWLERKAEAYNGINNKVNPEPEKAL